MTTASQPNNSKPIYRGRFAPSPTGPLHFGSLFTAVASYLQAKFNKGKWLVRIEDVDLTRIQKGASENIIKTLEKFSLFWDEDIYFQSKRYPIYNDYLNFLVENNLLYACTCTRKRIQKIAQIGKMGWIYPDTCRDLHRPISDKTTLRLKTNEIEIKFNDGIQGLYHQILHSDIGDQVLRRADNIISYHLAVVIDDFLQNISEVVRGSDLLSNTPLHLILQQHLDFPSPQYVHLPIILNKNHEKLSKQTGAHSIEHENTQFVLFQILRLLKQNPPADLVNCSNSEILDWGIKNWKIDNIKSQNISIDNTK